MGERQGKYDVQSRVKTGLVARVREWYARRVEAGLRRGVVLGVELKRDGVTRLSSNVCRLEGQSSPVTD